MVRVKEIFTSIQGEGKYVGYKQLFIRLCQCNLKCAYCDTDFNIKDADEYSINYLLKLCSENMDCHSVSLTGGEPLLEKDFIKEFGLKSPLPVYLETNGTLYKNLNEVIDFVTYIAADIKLPSASGNNPLWDVHEKFFEIASRKILFAKTVFDENITDEEILQITNLCKKHNTELILQPKMIGKLPSVNSTFMQRILNKTLKNYKQTRLIPQVHKFIDVQ